MNDIAEKNRILPTTELTDSSDGSLTFSRRLSYKGSLYWKTRLYDIRAQMKRSHDPELLVALEQQEINCLYALEGAPRDPLQAPAGDE